MSVDPHPSFCCFPLLAQGARAAWHPFDIQYRQAVTKILKRGDISWGTKADKDYKFGGVQVSADGSKVLFTGVCEYCSPAEVRPFLVDPDGSNLQDLAEILPPDVTRRWSGWRNLLINDHATKLFFRSYVETGYYDDQYIFVYDLSSSSRQHAVSQKISVKSNYHTFQNWLDNRAALRDILHIKQPYCI